MAILWLLRPKILKKKKNITGYADPISIKYECLKLFFFFGRSLQVYIPKLGSDLISPADYDQESGCLY